MCFYYCHVFSVNLSFLLHLRFLGRACTTMHCTLIKYTSRPIPIGGCWSYAYLYVSSTVFGAIYLPVSHRLPVYPGGHTHI